MHLLSLLFLEKVRSNKYCVYLPAKRSLSAIPIARIGRCGELAEPWIGPWNSDCISLHVLFCFLQQKEVLVQQFPKSYCVLGVSISL